MTARISTLCRCLFLGYLSSCLQAETRVIFEDNFDTSDSRQEAFTSNATAKEYGDNALAGGHLLRKWKTSWEYDAEGDWRQAFYAVAPGETVMTQAGRSACHNFNYRIAPNIKIPETAKAYTVSFRQMKWDNDTIYYLLGADENIWSETRFGFENQLPGSDETVNDMYLRGIFGNDVIKRNQAHHKKWVLVVVHVNLVDNIVKWKMAGELIAEAFVPQLKPGGYFGLYMCYERNTKFDDFVITVEE